MSEAVHPRTLVAGIGNIFLGDDGFGCEVIRALESKRLPAEVRVFDYGIRGLDLAYALLDSYENVILVDAIRRGGPPGTIYLLQPVYRDNEPAALDPHSMDPMSLLAMARSLGEIKAEVFIVGCEPQDFGDELEGRMGLSEVVAASVAEGANAVLDVIARVQGRQEHTLSEACAV